MHQKDKEISGTSRFSRRDLLLRAGGVGLWGVLNQPFLLCLAAQTKESTAKPAVIAPAMSTEDDQFLDELERRNFQFFWSKLAHRVD